MTETDDHHSPASPGRQLSERTQAWRLRPLQRSKHSTSHKVLVRVKVTFVSRLLVAVLPRGEALPAVLLLGCKERVVAPGLGLLLALACEFELGLFPLVGLLLAYPPRRTLPLYPLGFVVDFAFDCGEGRRCESSG